MLKKRARERGTNNTPTDAKANGTARLNDDATYSAAATNRRLYRLGRGVLLLLIGAYTLPAQPPGSAASIRSQPIRVVVESKVGAGGWAEFLRIAVPGVIGAGSAILAVFLTNVQNHKRQAENHRHERELLDLNLRNQEAKEVNEWFLAVYTTDAIELLGNRFTLAPRDFYVGK